MKQFILFARLFTSLCLLIPVIAQAQIDENPYPNYVVIGAFANQKNAVTFTRHANKNRFPAQFEMNHNRNLYYVYVLTTEDREYAISEALKLREETKYFDTWVYSGSFDLMEVIPGQQNQDVSPLTGQRIDAVTNVERNNEGGVNANLNNQVSGGGVVGNENGNNTVANPLSGENNKTTSKRSSRRQRRESSKATTSDPNPASLTSSNNNTDALQESSDPLSINGQTTGEPVTENNKATVAGRNVEKQQAQSREVNTAASENIRTGLVSAGGTSNQQQNKSTVGGKNASATTGVEEEQAVEDDRANQKTNETGARNSNGKTTTSTTTPSGTDAHMDDAATDKATSGNNSTTSAGEKSGTQNLAGTSQNRLSATGSTKDGRSIKSNTHINASGSETQRGAGLETTGKLDQSIAQQEPSGNPLDNNATRTTKNTTSSPSRADKTGEKSQSALLGDSETKGPSRQKAGDKEPVSVNTDQSKTTQSTTATEAGKKARGTSENTNTPLAGHLPVSEADSATAVRTVPERVATAPLEAEEVVGKSFYFQLYRADNREVVEGEVDAIDFEKARRMATYPANAPVKILMPQGKSKQISFVCQVFGYRKLQKEFDPANPSDDLYIDENENVVVPFELIRLQKGDIAIMYNVFFFKDAAVMRPESRFEVNNLLDLLKENPSYKIRIHGHTNGNNSGKIIRMGKPDNFYSLTQTKEGFGSAKKLSEERAIVIREYLISSGISADRMQVKAWGGKKPIHDKHSARAQENVRVEIEILSEP